MIYSQQKCSSCKLENQGELIHADLWFCEGTKKARKRIWVCRVCEIDLFLMGGRRFLLKYTNVRLNELYNAQIRD